MEFASKFFDWDEVKVARLWPNFFGKNEKSKILVIEDDDEMGAVIKKSLRSRISYFLPLSDHKFEFEYMDDPQAAMEYFFHMDDIDLIIIDWNLKSQNALEVLQMFDAYTEIELTAERLFRKTPVIILTPNDFEGRKLNLKHFYLYKTIPRDAPSEKIIEALSSTVESALTH